MPQAVTPSQTPPGQALSARRGLWATAGLVVLAAVLILAIGAAVLYLNRRAAAREILTGWLDRRGIDADVEIERLELDGFVGRVRIGDPANPDFAVERVEVDYAIAAPWSSSGLGLSARRVRLLNPVLRATWADGKLSLGSLDPLIAEFTGKPPRPDSRGPIVIVERGRLRLGTEYGPLDVTADARLDNNKLMRLHAVMPVAALKRGAVEAQGLGGVVDLTTTGDRVALAVDLGAARFRMGDASGEAVRLRGTGDLPYPDLKTRRGDGRAVLNLALTGARLKAGDSAARDAAVDLAFDGSTTGWIETFRIAGQTSASIRAASLTAPGLSTQSATVAVPGARLELSRAEAGAIGWSLTGPATLQAAGAAADDLSLDGATVRSGSLIAGGRGGAFEVSGPVAVSARRVGFGDLSLDRVTGTADLDLTHDGATLITLAGGLKAGGGAWPLFGPATADDVPELVEMKRALGAFALDVPAFRLTAGSPGTRVVLTRPARLTPGNGGVLTLNPAATPIFEAGPGERGGGALSLTATRGRGLPEATVAIPRWSLTERGFDARLEARAALDFGIARGLNISTGGTLTSNAGVLTYATTDCLDFTAERLELDDNDAMDLSGKLCPTGGPLVTVRDGGWRAGGALSGVVATAPFLQMRFDQAQGTVAVVGGPAGLGLDARIASARVQDTTEPRRFNPLSASGVAALKDERWTGAFDIVSGASPVGRVVLNHDGASETGGVVFDTPGLVFADGGLQPDALTPLVDGLVESPVTGAVDFTGRFDWSPTLPEGGASSGVLTVPGLDFVSPAGPVKGLKGRIEFTSLAPLTTAPGQPLSLDSLETVTPLTNLGLTFAIDAATISVAGAEIEAAGGHIRVEPFTLPLDVAQGFGGVIVFDRVQLGEVLKGAGFGDNVQLDAVVSGRLPFTYSPATGIRITRGALAAVQPGRLSIKRDVLTDIQTGGGQAEGAAVPPGTVEDLAYQAMEDLAFDTLSADVNSLEAGRVGVLFHIKGRHDPPERQELRLTLAELISRQFLNRPLPLPSDTGIDLTLDTTLNLNQLVSDLMAVNRARNGEDAASGPEPIADTTPTPALDPATP